MLCLTVLLLSGLQIFNAHPALYWGQYGADSDHSGIEIGAVEGDGGLRRRHPDWRPLRSHHRRAWRFGRPYGELTARAFPSWLTMPSYQDLPRGRRWHFFFAWVFVLNGLVYLVYGIAAGHFRRDLTSDPRPAHAAAISSTRSSTTPGCAFPKGRRRKRYNALQKLTYLGVIFVLLPGMVATGLTMSPGSMRSRPGCSMFSAAGNPPAPFISLRIAAGGLRHRPPRDGGAVGPLEQSALHDHRPLCDPHRGDTVMTMLLDRRRLLAGLAPWRSFAGPGRLRPPCRKRQRSARAQDGRAPDHGRAAALLSDKALAREFTEADLSPVFRANGTAMPDSEDYASLMEADFRTGGSRSTVSSPSR